MREIVKLTLLLTLISAICAALLAFVQKSTDSKRSLTASLKCKNAAAAVMPSGTLEEVTTTTADDKFSKFVCRDKSGKIIATAVETVSHNGYGGDIRIMVGFDAVANEVVDFVVLAASETPGLGAKITSDKFRSGLRGKAMSANFSVKKDGGDIDAVTSATISSRAVLEAVRDAITIHKEILRQVK